MRTASSRWRNKVRPRPRSEPCSASSRPRSRTTSRASGFSREGGVIAESAVSVERQIRRLRGREQMVSGDDGRCRVQRHAHPARRDLARPPSSNRLRPASRCSTRTQRRPKSNGPTDASSPSGFTQSVDLYGSSRFLRPIRRCRLTIVSSLSSSTAGSPRGSLAARPDRGDRQLDRALGESDPASKDGRPNKRNRPSKTAVISKTRSESEARHRRGAEGHSDSIGCGRGIM
jgi:hypothetical protein